MNEQEAKKLLGGTAEWYPSDEELKRYPNSYSDNYGYVEKRKKELGIK